MSPSTRFCWQILVAWRRPCFLPCKVWEKKITTLISFKSVFSHFYFVTFFFWKTIVYFLTIVLELKRKKITRYSSWRGCKGCKCTKIRWHLEVGFFLASHLSYDILSHNILLYSIQTVSFNVTEKMDHDKLYYGGCNFRI